MAKTRPRTKPDKDHEESDGRRRRSRSSRARIVDALSRLVSQGNVAPVAARVAEVAGVSLRTVFRHFDDMDSLYREIAESVQAHVLPAFFRPYTSSDWRDRLREMVDRRIELYEVVLPYKVAGDLRRFHSEFISQDYRNHLKLEKMTLDSVLPEDIDGDSVVAQALRAATAFHTWSMLRRDQGLGVDEARAVMLHSVEALLATLPPAPARPSPSRK